MSFCQEDGKDKYVFLTVKDASKPSKLPIPEEIERPEKFVKGFVDKGGNLNWECACRGSMVASKCGVESRAFFQCIHENIDKSDKFNVCIDPLVEMQKCMEKYPEQYPMVDDKEDVEDTEDILPGIKAWKNTPVLNSSGLDINLSKCLSLVVSGTEETPAMDTVDLTDGFVDKGGNLNWECACRGSMVASRCGVEMRGFFQCIHDNMDNEEKSDACLEPFHAVKACMDKNPKHYKDLEEASPERVVSEETSK